MRRVPRVNMPLVTLLKLYIHILYYICNIAYTLTSPVCSVVSFALFNSFTNLSNSLQEGMIFVCLVGESSIWIRSTACCKAYHVRNMLVLVAILIASVLLLLSLLLLPLGAKGQYKWWQPTWLPHGFQCAVCLFVAKRLYPTLAGPPFFPSCSLYLCSSTSLRFYCSALLSSFCLLQLPWRRRRHMSSWRLALWEEAGDASVLLPVKFHFHFFAALK